MDLQYLKSTFFHLEIDRPQLDQFWPWVRDHFVHKRTVHQDVNLELSRIKAELERGVPIQYVLGWAPFMEFIFNVSPDVLIPRSETEELVYFMRKHYYKEFEGTFLDVGTGSGAIAIALATHFRNATVKAIDVSAPALELACSNAEASEATVIFKEMDFLKEETTENVFFSDVDVIVSNPPYIDKKEQGSMDLHVIDHEPDLALYGPEENALLFYKLLAERHSEKADVWVEMNALQHDKIKQYFEEHDREVKIYDDLQGMPRVLFSPLNS